MRHRLGVASLAILTVVFAVGLFANQLAPYSYGHANVDALSSSPSWAHPFGTDQIGRDYFSSALLGLKTEVEIVLIVGLVGGLIGTAIGAAAGYLGGYTDSVVMRLADLLLTVPPLVTVLVAAAFLHTNTVRVYTSRDAGRTGRRQQARRSGSTPVRSASPRPPSTAVGANTSPSPPPGRVSKPTSRRTSSRRYVPARAVLGRCAGSRVAPDGTLYVTGIAAGLGVWVARSADKGKTFRLVRVAALPGNRAADCATASGHPAPFQGVRCLGPNPRSSRRVTGSSSPTAWAGRASRRACTWVSSTRRCGPSGQGRSGRRIRGPTVLAVGDFRRGERAAVGVLLRHQCDPGRGRAWYSCTSSRGGRRWAKPVRAARGAASADVLWADARIYEYGDTIGYGATTAVAATEGAVHPLWIDTSDPRGRRQEVFAATLP